MRIDRAIIEDRLEEARYRLGRLREEPEALRKVIMIAVASLAVTITLAVWIARLLPDAPPPGSRAEAEIHETKADWVAGAARRLGRDDRFSNVAVTYTGASIIVQGRVDTNAELVELRQTLLRSRPPVAIQWQISVDQ